MLGHVRREWSPNLSRILNVGLVAVSAVVTLGVAPVIFSGTAVAAGGTAPACVSRTVSTYPDGGGVVALENGCKKAMRVSIVFKSGAESICYPMSIGQRRVLSYDYPLVYARTAVC